MVDHDRVASDHSGPLEALDAPGDRRGGQGDPFAYVGHGPPGVLGQQLNDLVIGLIEIDGAHGTSINTAGPFCIFHALNERSSISPLREEWKNTALRSRSPPTVVDWCGE